MSAPETKAEAKAETESGPPDETTAERVAAGLARIGTVLRFRAWNTGERNGLTPTQAQILASIQILGAGASPSAVATRLQVTRPTVSDALTALLRKGLVLREQADNDRRGALLRLTERGNELATEIQGWPKFLSRAIENLPDSDQGTLLRGISGTIRALQHQGDIPVQRLCITCRYFDAHRYDDAQAPHHCAYVDAPFGDRQLRIDCGEQLPATAEQEERNWTALHASRPATGAGRPRPR